MDYIKEPLYKRPAVWILIAVLLFAVLFAIATPYVNGTDQYWHYNYIQSILKGDYTSNELYPSFVLENSWDGSRTGFIHNMPVLYVWAFFSYITGSLYRGAMFFNFLCAVFSAYFMYLAVKAETDRKCGIIAFFITLFFPVAYWQSVQLLTESSALLFLSAGVFLLSRKRPAAHLAAAVLLALCANSRANVLVIAALLLVFSCVRACRRLSKKQFALYCVSLFAVFALSYWVLGRIFGDPLDFTTGRSLPDKLAVVSTFDQRTNMALHYSTLKFSDIGLGTMLLNFLGKLITALKTQFAFNGMFSLAFWAENILFAAAIVLFILERIKSKKRVVKSPLFWLLTAIAVSWAASSVLYQNQFRYHLIYLPATVGVICACWHSLGFGSVRKAAILMAAAMILMIAADGTMTYVSKTDAESEHTVYSVMQQTLDREIPADVPVAAMYLPWTQLLYPRTATLIDPGYAYTKAELGTLILGRYQKNAYFVTGSGLLCDPNTQEIVKENYTLIFSDKTFDIYKLKK